MITMEEIQNNIVKYYNKHIIPKNISIKEFNKTILKKIESEDDKNEILSAYAKRDDYYFYREDTDEKKQKLIIRILRKIGYAVNMEAKVRTLPDQFIKDFKREIKKAKIKHKEFVVKAMREIEPDFIEQLEEIDELDEENDVFDLKIMEIIEDKVTDILHYLKINFYDKEDLKKLIVKDMMDFFIRQNLSKTMKQKITSVIANSVDHEFKEYQKNKILRRKQLLTELLQDTLPFLNKAFKEHKIHKIKKMTFYQMQHFVEYLNRVIDEKFIQPDKEKKKLNNEEYNFLKSKIKEFISRRYEALFQQSRTINNKLNNQKND